MGAWHCDCVSETVTANFSYRSVADVRISAAPIKAHISVDRIEKAKRFRIINRHSNLLCSKCYAVLLQVFCHAANSDGLI
jgi:hypothetical protein